MPSLMRRPWAVIVSVGLLVAPCASAEDATGVRERRLVDGIAAVVGDEIILESEVDEEFYVSQMRAGRRISGDEAATVRSEILRGMVDETLLVAMARRDTIRLERGELEKELERRVDALRERHGSDEALNAALEAEGLTLGDLRDIYRDGIERRLLAEKVVQAEVHSKISVTWGEVEEYYEEHAEEVARVPEAYQVAGILIAPKVSEAAKRSAIERLNRAREMLDQGRPFEELAREFSDDASAEVGGDLGTFGRGVMVPEFEEAAFALDEGQVSGIVPSRFGFHIIQVLEKDETTVRARHILARVARGPEDEDRARAVAESLRQLIVDGGDFAEIAREHSDDEASREAGGVLGWFAVDDMAPSIRSVILGLDVGEVGDAVRGDTGYYVIKLLAHEEERIAPLDEVRTELKDYIFGLKVEEGLNALIERLSDEIYVDVRAPTVSPG